MGGSLRRRHPLLHCIVDGQWASADSSIQIIAAAAGQAAVGQCC